MSGEEIKIKIINNTGKRIFVAPRDFSLDGIKGKKQFHPSDITTVAGIESDVLNQIDQRDSLPLHSLYCQAPARIDPTTGRGLWAMRLDPEGLDKKKSVSTKRFPVYRKWVVNQIQKMTKSTPNEEAVNKIMPKSLTNARKAQEKASFELRPYYRLYFKKKEGEWKLENKEKL